MNNERTPLREEAQKVVAEQIPKKQRTVEKRWDDHDVCEACEGFFIKGAEWLQSQSLPAEQPEKSLQECKEHIAHKYYDATFVQAKGFLSTNQLIDLTDAAAELYAAHFKQPSQQPGKTLEPVKLPISSHPEP